MPGHPAPAVVPVFPLTGTLLLPGNWLPLNIFEPRYRSMVADAMAGGRHIGMIQPYTPQQDNWPALEEPPRNPALYDVGCAGRIARCEPQSDGRYLIVLKGISRFRVREELPLVRGYRRVQADYEGFPGDLLEPETSLDPARLLHAVRAYAKAHGLEIDLDMLAALPGVALLNGLAVALPFHSAEKQALLEAPGPSEREELLVALLGMGLDLPPPGGYPAPPTVH